VAVQVALAELMVSEARKPVFVVIRSAELALCSLLALTANYQVAQKYLPPHRYLVFELVD